MCWVQLQGSHHVEHLEEFDRCARFGKSDKEAAILGIPAQSLFSIPLACFQGNIGGVRTQELSFSLGKCRSLDGSSVAQQLLKSVLWATGDGALGIALCITPFIIKSEVID